MPVFIYILLVSRVSCMCRVCVWMWVHLVAWIIFCVLYVLSSNWTSWRHSCLALYCYKAVAACRRQTKRYEMNDEKPKLKTREKTVWKSKKWAALGDGAGHCHRRTSVTNKISQQYINTYWARAHTHYSLSHCSAPRLRIKYTCGARTCIIRFRFILFYFFALSPSHSPLFHSVWSALSGLSSISNTHHHHSTYSSLFTSCAFVSVSGFSFCHQKPIEPPEKHQEYFFIHYIWDALHCLAFCFLDFCFFFFHFVRSFDSARLDVRTFRWSLTSAVPASFHSICTTTLI